MFLSILGLGVFMFLKPFKTPFIRASDISRGRGPAKSREIPKKTRNTAQSTRNISKYMSAKQI